MAGIDLTGPRRSELLSALLQKQLQPQQNIRSGGELGARLLAQLLQQKKIDKLQGAEAQRANELARVMSGQSEQATGGSSVTLEDFEGGSGRQQVAIPGKRGVNLDPEQQAALQEFQAGQRALNAPSLEEEIGIRADAERGLIQERGAAQRENTQLQNAAALERTQLQAAAAETRVEKQLEARASQADKDRLARETSDIREIQATFALERLKNEIKKESSSGSLDLNEQEAKATGWYISAVSGKNVIQRELDSGYTPSINAVSLYAKSIDPDTGAATRVQLRRAIKQRDLNFLDATNMIVDPVVRQRTGAAVRTDEFITTFNSIVPIGDDPQESINKQSFRDNLIEGLGAITGRGKEVGDRILEKNGMPRNLGLEQQANNPEIEKIDAELAALDEQLKALDQ